MGRVEVPAAALWGAQTQRALENFKIGGLPLPAEFIQSLALIKQASAEINGELGLLSREQAQAIARAAGEIASGGYADQFPLDVYQTGSGTSTHMNVNEVIARLAARNGVALHPNDHVNLGQSSNDVIPAAIHLSAARELRSRLAPALGALAQAIGRKATEAGDLVKTGRTHLMDAMPLTVAQELSGWRAQVEQGLARLGAVEARLHRLALGGTAVGTGINAHPEFGARVTARLAQLTSLPLSRAENSFEAQSSQDTALELSGQLRVVGVSLNKIANDLRWMNSGPLAGLAEITLPALQPGSSIMPGKVNPVAPEAACMAIAQVMGHDAAIAHAAQASQFQLNTMMPLIAFNLLDSIRLLAGAARLLAEGAIAGMRFNAARIGAAVARNPMLITALAPRIGYAAAAAIAKQAYEQGRPILELALEHSGLARAELERLLDPLRLTQGGVRGGD